MKKTTRNKLLFLASLLDRRATAIRKFVRARTPKRVRKEKEIDRPSTPLERAFQTDAARIGAAALRRIGQS